MAREGLRTLVVGKKRLSVEQFTTFDVSILYSCPLKYCMGYIFAGNKIFEVKIPKINFSLNGHASQPAVGR